jgi:hypothetical protein
MNKIEAALRMSDESENVVVPLEQLKDILECPVCFTMPQTIPVFQVWNKVIISAERRKLSHRMHFSPPQKSRY